MDNCLKSDEMDMMMMTTMMQNPIDYTHHHHHHHAPFINLPSSTLPQPFPVITAPTPTYPSGSVYTKRSTGNGSSSSMAAMREMIFRMAVMQPVHIDPESVKPPKRRNVRISKDPQSVAARHRRERISEKIRILQRLVPGGTKMDMASMLDEAIHYVKFLKTQVQSLERVSAVNGGGDGGARSCLAVGMGFPVPMSAGSYASAQSGSQYGDGFD